MKKFFKKLFCKHKFVWKKKYEPYNHLGGYTKHLICEKCGKVKMEVFVDYDY